MSAGSARLIDRRSALWLTFCFLASRLVFFRLGVRFDASPLGVFWQYLDPRLLEGDLLRSVFYLHSQPPLFNLLLGAVLKLSPVDPSLAFHALYLVAGWLCLLASYLLARLLGVGRWIAGAAGMVLVTRPSFILFENWLMYDVPVALLVCLSGVALALFARRGTPFYAHAFFGVLLVLCATRSLFHLVYFGAALALVTGMTELSRRRIVLKSAAVPFVLLVLLYAKNFVVFGHLGLSSWLGMNLARIATAAAPEEELARLHRQGELSAAATVPPFSPLSRYDDLDVAPARYPHVPALADRYKSTGSVNYNHEAYISISRRYLGDALWIVRHRPVTYLHGTAKAWYNYFKPQTEISQVSVNRDRMRGYADAVAWVLYGRLPVTFDYGGEARPIYLFSTLGIPLLTLYALWLTFRDRDAAARRVLAFMALTAIYVALLGNSLEVWENQRFRFYTDPFFAAFLALAADRALRSVSREQSTSGNR